MTSDEAKTKLLAYWRFERRFPYVATECGPYESDVLIADGKQTIECEVKVSKADLIKDKKKKKHAIYGKARTRKTVPNKFYYAVPSELVSEAKKEVEDTPYGVIEIKDTEIKKVKKRGVYCSIVVSAKPLTKTYSGRLERSVILRMGSELIRARLSK